MREVPAHTIQCARAPLLTSRLSTVATGPAPLSVGPDLCHDLEATTSRLRAGGTRNSTVSRRSAPTGTADRRSRGLTELDRKIDVLGVEGGERRGERPR
jgi:hypothetical protein